MRSSTSHPFLTGITPMPYPIPQHLLNKQPFYDTTNQYFCLYDSHSHTKERLYTESEVKAMVDKHVLASKILNKDNVAQNSTAIKQELMAVLTEYKVKLEEITAKYNLT